MDANRTALREPAGRSDTTSPTLLSRVRNPRDAAAWREFDARYGELIVRYCRRRGVRYTDAEDIRQIVMSRLSRALRDFQYEAGRGKFRNFLGRIVRNETVRYFRSPKSAPRRVDGWDGAEDDSSPPDDCWEREWVNHHLRLAMQHLRERSSPHCVAVFEVLLGGRSVQETAEMFGMTPEAVHKIKQRVRDRLRSRIAEQIREEDGPDADRRRTPTAR